MLAGRIGAKRSIALGLVGLHGHLHFRLFHEDRDSFPDARGPGRDGAGGDAGPEPLAVRQPDPAGQVGGVFRVLRGRREVRRHLRAGDLRPRSTRDWIEPRVDLCRSSRSLSSAASCCARSTSPRASAWLGPRTRPRQSIRSEALISPRFTLGRLPACFRQCITLIDPRDAQVIRRDRGATQRQLQGRSGRGASRRRWAASRSARRPAASRARQRSCSRG